MNVTAYIRVSGKRQVRNSSLETQRARVRQHSKTKYGVSNPEIFADAGVSGASLDRPALQQLIELIEKGNVNVLLVATMDRLSRNADDTAWFIAFARRHGCRVESVADGFDSAADVDGLALGERAAESEREWSAARDRSITGQAAARAAGKPVNHLAIGEEYKNMGRAGRRVVVSERDLDILDRIDELKYHGEKQLSLSEIAVKLNEEGFRTKKNKPFTKRAVEVWHNARWRSGG